MKSNLTTPKRGLLSSIKALIADAQKHVIHNINTTMLLTYFEIGRMIVVDEQKGKRRAEYSKETLQLLSKELTKEFGKGFSYTNLEYIRKFYKIYHSRIPQSVIEESGKMLPAKTRVKKQPIRSAFPFSLSWTHYIQLLKIDNEEERKCYEIEAARNSWSVRELIRQYNSAFYERLALSKDKKSIKKLSQKGQIVEKPADALKSHYVLEFLDLKEDKCYTENELETAIINKLEHFMLELGKGFLFEGRQRRFTIGGDSFYVDLVFYNRLMKCFVLFDLKIGKLTHQDIGQMLMYVNYYDRKIKVKNENKTIGIILCKEENKAVVEFTLPENNRNIFAKEYKEILPSKTDLKKTITITISLSVIC